MDVNVMLTTPKTLAVERPLILHTRTVTGVGGGPEKTILNSPRYLRTLGFESACLYLYPDGDPGIEVLKQKANDATAELIAWPDGAPIDFALVRRLQEFCRARNVSVWHAHDYKTNVLGLLVRRRWPMQLVTTSHGWGVAGLKNRLYATVGKACLPLYDAVVAVSEDLHSSSRRWRVAEHRRHLISNAIDMTVYRRTLSREQARHQFLGADSDEILLAAVGRLSTEKGFHLLIDAVAELRRMGCAVTLVIGGEGGCRAALERQIQRLQLQPFVRLVGQVADPKILFQAADMFVLSSTKEGLPNVVLEAMALECPLVATRVAGVPSLVKDQVHGLLVDSGNVPQLVAAIDRLAKNPSLRDELARNAREHVVESFAFDKRMQKVAAVYDQLLR